MANAINIPITYSVQSVDKLLNDFDTIVKDSDLGDAFLPDQQKIRTQFAGIKAQIADQLKDGGKIDLSKIDFTGLQKSVEDFAKKTAFVLDESFDKSSKMKEMTAISDELTRKMAEQKTLNEQLLAMEQKKAEFKEKYALGKMPTLDLDTAKKQLAGAEARSEASPQNDKLKLEVEKRKELVAILEEEKSKKQQIKDTIAENSIDIDNLIIEKKEKQVELDKERLRLGDEANNQSQKLMNVSVGIGQLRDAGNEATGKVTEDIKKNTEATEAGNKADKKHEKTLSQKIATTFSYGLILNQLKKVLRATISTVLDLDKAMTTAAMITGMNRQEAYKLMGSYQELARSTGLATSEIADVITQFLRQGRSIAEAMELAEVAAKSAKVAGISANDAVNFLTSAVNGFGMAANQAVDIADKFAAVAAQSASSFQELATAMSKVAPVAKSAGVGVDFMMGVLAKGLETTREAPENIGTAFKTIFARMREVTDIGKATEDGMSLNRVEKSLQSIGVTLRDAGGQFRNLEDVLIDVGDKWNTLTSIEQAYIATTLAGTRQQPRLLAIFNDFARTKELIQISSDATGELAFQHMEYMMGAEAALANLKTAWQAFTMTFTDSEIVIGTIRGITDAINGLSSMFKGIGNESFRNIAILGALAVAYAMLLPQTAANLTNKFLDIQLTKQQNKLNPEQEAQLQKINEELRTSVGLRRQELIEKKKQLAADAGLELGIKANIKALGTQILLQLKAIALSLLVTLAMAGLVALGKLIYDAFKEATMGADQLADRIDRNNKALNDLKNKEKNIKTLTDRFDELNKKVVKTTADVEELKNIATELSEVKVGDQTFQLARTDIAGNQTLDRSAIEAFNAAIENERQELLEKNMDSFTKALARDGVKAFEEFTIQAMARDIGYNFGIDFLNAMKGSMTESQVDSVMQQLRSGINKIAPDLFTNVKFKTTASNYKTEGLDVRLTTLLAGLNTYEEMADKIKGQLTLQGLQEGTKEFNDALEIALNSLRTITTTSFDEEKAKAYAQSFTNILIKASNFVDSNTGPNSTLSQTLKARLDSYRNAVQNVKDEFDGLEEEVTLKFLSESMYDEAIMESLMSRGMSLDVIVNIIEAGSSLEEVNDLIEGFGKNLRDMNTGAGDMEIDSMMTRYSEAAALLFSGNFEEGYSKLFELLNGLGDSELTVSGINDISNALGLLNATTAAGRLKDSGSLVQDLLKLPEQISKGDFSKYTELVEEFGFEAVNAVLDGSSPALSGFIDDQANKFEEDILKSINNIKSANMVLNDGVLNLSNAEKDQIAQLELMLKYYEKIAGVEQLRKHTLDTVKTIVKETNDLYSLQEKLLAGGMTGDDTFMKILDKAIETSEKDTISLLGQQLEKDMALLDQLGVFVDGVFKPFSDASKLDVDSGLSNMYETVTQLVDLQTAAYQRQQKQIEERYKTEMDAIKSAHDEKWSELDYNSKLAESEQKIIESRRQLMGLALSGAGQGEYKDAQNALEKLQQEREKIIEDKMINDAQKELEEQKNQDLIKAQTDFTEAIKKYTDQLTAIYTGGAGVSTNTGTSPNVGFTQMSAKVDVANVKLDETTLALDDLKASNMLSIEKTTDLITTNETLILEIQGLSRTISNWKVSPSSGSQTDGIGT